MIENFKTMNYKLKVLRLETFILDGKKVRIKFKVIIKLKKLILKL